MEKQIDRDQVIMLFENNFFDYDETRNMMVYCEHEPKIEFPVPWFKTDPAKLYDLAMVRQTLREMMYNVQHTQNIKDKVNDPEFSAMLIKEMTDFGMEYVENLDLFAYPDETGKYIFSFDLEYLVSLLVIYKDETVKSLLTAMRDEHNGGENGQTTQATASV